jgi:Tfp pilus assembly protein PilV
MRMEQSRREKSETGRRSAEAGFTIVEGLVAALILAVILIGILPLITRSMQNNLQGNDATNEANAVTDRDEELISLPFNDQNLAVATGATSQLTTDYYSLANNAWSTTSGGADDQYTRAMTVEYFGGADLSADGTLDTPLDGGSLPGSIQFKRITLEISKRRVLDTSGYTVVVLKAY